MKNKKMVIALASMLIAAGSVMPAYAQGTVDTFDARTYADTYPDLKAAFGYDAEKLLTHYLTFGKTEGRDAKAFDYKAYADAYADLKAAFGYDAEKLYNHYLTYGKAEGRTANFTEAAANALEMPTQTKTTEPAKNTAPSPNAGSVNSKTPPPGWDPAAKSADWER